MKVIITGSSGQLGSELKDLWMSNKEYDLVFLDRAELDLSKPEDIEQILSQQKPDYIIHSGAYTAVDLAETELELANTVNHLATLEIAKYAEKNAVKLIYISTDYVFPGNVDMALEEDFPTDPINVYGETKRKGELAVLQHGENGIIIRTAWVYSVYGKNFVKTMLNLMHTRDEINVVSDQIGTPTYAYDLAILIKQIVKGGNWVPGIYHYSNEGRISWYDFSVAIRDLENLSCKINPIASSAFPTAAKRPRFSLLSKEKVKRVFRVKVPGWKDSLRVMLDKLKH